MANFFPLNANTTLKVDNKTSKELLRPLANFSPCKWGDRFLSFSLDKVELEAYAKASEEPKEELRRLLIDPTIDSNAKLSLIYSMYRLGLTYLFMEEIDGLLDKLFNEHNLQDYDEADLYTISIHFHVFRIHGYKLSCDVFNKFMDNGLGTFKEYIISDVKGMLSFYESAHLGIKGESILDEALQFTEAQLKSVVNTLEGNLASQVKQALRGPFHRGLPIVEARLYFSNYEEDFSTNDSLLKLAKSHFNYLQLQQKEELRIISKWCRDMEFNVITPYIRDRVPELYLWILTFFFEPHYSQARIITSKIVQLVLVLDDTMDAYATIDEMRLLMDSINRWETSAMEQLPGYMKPFYKIILNEYAELEKQLAKEGKEDRVKPSKEAFQELARAYLKEAEWRHSGEMPSFKEYTKNGLTTSAYDLMCKSALLGMKENIANEKIWAWFETHPKILKASEFISRFHNDVMTFEFERERTQSATGVDAYVKTYGVPENVAIVEIKKMVENAWKDINEGCLKPREIPMDILVPIVNLARVIDVVYKYGDEFTFPKKSFKEYITLLFIDSVTK